jgi:hypothetical protein
MEAHPVDTGLADTSRSVAPPGMAGAMPAHETERRGLHSGHIVALASAVVVLGSLWAPWLTFAAPPLRESGWHAADLGSTGLAVGAGLVILLVVLATGGFGVTVNRNSAARLIFVLGLFGVGAVVWWMEYAPAGSKWAWGAFVALAACLVVTIGGALAAVTTEPQHNQALDELAIDATQRVTVVDLIAALFDYIVRGTR